VTSNWGDRIICIGASTGGTEAIKEVLCRLPANVPGIVLVQHMPEMFTASFARRLDTLARIRVKEAEHGERILPGHAYLAPGHSHLEIRKSGTGYVCELLQTPPFNRHRPAVDVLFNSAAVSGEAANAVAALLTGMGKDGAQGMLAMRQAGAWTIGQDQESCVVYGMPREAAQIGACCEVSPVTQIAERIMAALQGGKRMAAHGCASGSNESISKDRTAFIMEIKVNITDKVARMAMGGRFDFSAHRNFRETSEDLLAKARSVSSNSTSPPSVM
jgi:two-component system chemotaxis response regulator CheB